MQDTSAASAPGLAMDMCLSMSLPKGGYPFVIGDRSCGVFLAFKLVDEITTIARFVADSRLTHAMWRRVQCPHVGSASSHFFLRATHVKHPVFDFSLSMMVRQTPKDDPWGRTIHLVSIRCLAEAEKDSFESSLCAMSVGFGSVAQRAHSTSCSW